MVKAFFGPEAAWREKALYVTEPATHQWLPTELWENAVYKVGDTVTPDEIGQETHGLPPGTALLERPGLKVRVLADTTNNDGYIFTDHLGYYDSESFEILYIPEPDKDETEELALTLRRFLVPNTEGLGRFEEDWRQMAKYVLDNYEKK